MLYRLIMITTMVQTWNLEMLTGTVLKKEKALLLTVTFLLDHPAHILQMVHQALTGTFQRQ